MRLPQRIFAVFLICLASGSIAWRAAGAVNAQAAALTSASFAVGAQYDTTHVYIDPRDFDRFVTSFVATFGGKPSARIVANLLPVPSNTQAQYVRTPIGTLSVFAFLTPIPYPFGQERTGYLVTDMDRALEAARQAGAEVVVDKYKDPIGLDAVIQWPGGVKMQLYWHTVAPSYAQLDTIPDNRIYVSREAADAFVHDFIRFSHGRVVSDIKRVNATEIGRPGETYHRVRIESVFGKMQVTITDGHLPYPFGHELTGYEVANLTATLHKAQASGAKVLWGPVSADDRGTAMVEFPGGYIAEIHAPSAP